MSNLFKILLWAFLACFTGSTLYGQDLLHGQVLDAHTKEPLLGVHVITLGSSNGTITDQTGHFQLSAYEGAVIDFSFIGYQTQTFRANGEQIQVFLEPSLVELNQLIVSASRESQRREDIPMAVAKLDAKELEAAKASSLEQVINKVSGVFMVNLGNEQHKMSVRQPLSLKSLFLYLEDGIPVRPTGVFNHNALIEMNMATVQSIEVVKGPASSIYGSEAIGGSINFLTKKAAAFPTATLSLQRDNLGYKRVDFGAGNTFNQLGLYVGGYYANRKEGYRSHSDFSKLALSMRADFKIGEKDKLTTTASLIDYQADMSGSIDSADFYSRNYPSLHSFTDRTVKAFRVRSTLEHFWTEESKTAFTVVFRNNLIGQNPAYRVKNDLQNRLKASGEINESRFQSYGAIIQHLENLSFWNATLIGGLSIDYSPNKFVAEYIDISRDEAGNYVSYEQMDSVLTNYQVRLFNSAAYAQLELSPVKNLRVAMALRYDHFLYNYNNQLTSNAFSGAPDSKDKFENLSPKVGFTYDFGKTGIYSNYSIGFVPPQISELYRGVKVPVLGPSVYRNYEVGGWWAFGNAIFDYSVYRLDGTNEIVNVLMEDGSRENRNAGETRHFGVEYNLRYVPVESLRLRIGGTNARHEYVDYVEQGKTYNGNSMEAAPDWIFNTEVSYSPAILKGARVALEWQHLGPYYMDASNTERYEGFDILNLRMGYQIKGFDIWLNVMNLTDQLYATNAAKTRYGKDYSPGDPRTFSIGIGYNFSKNI